MEITEMVDLFTGVYDNDEDFVVSADVLEKLIRCYIERELRKGIIKLEKVN